MKGRTLTNCTWMKPDGDVLKLNLDGSVTNDNTGFGGTLRDSNGEVRLAYTGSNGPRSVLFQELQGTTAPLLLLPQSTTTLQHAKVEMATPTPSSAASAPSPSGSVSHTPINEPTPIDADTAAASISSDEETTLFESL
ncbi:hypothetical protein IFM89_004337 [Coptis chinensis]|uniref:Uncharacterized protein n=1 Tax=Coptis chinensis TaxID=261450 RepID=A0A835I8T1_9MAGN|nr:hypothetical protein IFM89_004337 [Coptis chinensis]